MGFFDFLNKPIPGLNKPNPQMVLNQLNEAVRESNTYSQQGDKENALKDGINPIMFPILQWPITMPEMFPRL